MAKSIGAAGRAARDLARRRFGALPAPFPVDPLSLPLVQAAAGDEPVAAVTGSPASAQPPAVVPAAMAIERETPAVSAEAVAERVYNMLRRDLRLERERRGH